MRTETAKDAKAKLQEAFKQEDAEALFKNKGVQFPRSEDNPDGYSTDENARKIKSAEREGARGRKDKDGQEAVITIKQMTPKEITELVEKEKHLEAVTADINDAVKAKAEQYGVKASALRKYIKAKAGYKFEEKKNSALQLALVFETLN